MFMSKFFDFCNLENCKFQVAKFYKIPHFPKIGNIKSYNLKPTTTP